MFALRAVVPSVVVLRAVVLRAVVVPALVRPARLAVACLAALALTAQQPVLDAAALPTRLEASAAHLPPGAVATLVLGLAPVQVVLPGGALLGVRPDVLGGFAVVDATGRVEVATPLVPELCAGLSFLVQVAALSPTATFATTPVRAVRAPAPGDEADVYLLFGQSNAQGHASTEALPDALRRPLLTGRLWDIGAGTFAAVRGDGDRFGPELALLHGLSGGERTVWLVKLAVDMSPLGPGDGPMNEWGADAGELYAVLLAVTDAAAGDLRAQGLVPRVRGIAMMQGESDATDAALALGYGERLARLVRQLRQDLSARQLADDDGTPFVIGRIARDLVREVFPWGEAVRAAQDAVASATPACVAVDTDDLALQADRTHFAADGVVGLGRAFAAALRRLASVR